MKKHLLIIALIASFGVSNAQKSQIAGSWLITKVEFNDKVQKPYMIINFSEDGKMIMMETEFGTWNYNKKSNELVMTSDFDKDFNGNGKILALTEKELVTKKDGAKITYQKLDLEKIIVANKNSGLIGTWHLEVTPNTNTKSFISFNEPNQFTIIQKGDYSESKIQGSWIFNKKEKSLILIGFRGENLPKGKCEIISLNADEFELKNNGQVYKAKRKEQSSQKIERLTFSEEDFYTEDGNYKYDYEEDKLPWKDHLSMMIELVNVKQLVYNYATLINDTETFENKLLKADVNANPQDLQLNIDNIFIGFDRYNLPEDTAFPSNPKYTNPLYPLDDSTFRIVGSEQITTPAGTFNCTVIEVYGDRETRKKIWMANNLFGVLVKIIEDNPDEHFGYYHIYELQEIIKSL